MNRDYIDVSVGLHFALELLKRYRESGLLQASVLRLPGIAGKCEVSITIVQGGVTSCLARDKQGYVHSTDLQVLLKLDRDRGPFEWNLLPYEPQIRTDASAQYPSSALSEQLAPNRVSPYTAPLSPRPHKIALLNLNLLTAWPPEQKRALFMLYELIDGKRTIEDIKHTISFSPQMVEEGLHILVSLHVITIAE